VLRPAGVFHQLAATAFGCQRVFLFNRVFRRYDVLMTTSGPAPRQPTIGANNLRTDQTDPPLFLAQLKARQIWFVAAVQKACQRVERLSSVRTSSVAANGKAATPSLRFIKGKMLCTSRPAARRGRPARLEIAPRKQKSNRRQCPSHLRGPFSEALFRHRTSLTTGQYRHFLHRKRLALAAAQRVFVGQINTTPRRKIF